MEISFRQINFSVDLFSWMQIFHFLSGFVFPEDDVLIISRGLIFVVARYVIFMSSKIIAGKKQSFAKSAKTY